MAWKNMSTLSPVCPTTRRSAPAGSAGRPLHRLVRQAPSSPLTNHRCECAESLVDRCRVGEHIEDVRIDYHDVRSLRIPGRGDSSVALGEVVFRTHRVAIGVAPPTPSALSHTFFAPS